jgi:hypothetical protein
MLTIQHCRVRFEAPLQRPRSCRAKPSTLNLHAPTIDIFHGNDARLCKLDA